jgi:hypothetical protein
MGRDIDRFGREPRPSREPRAADVRHHREHDALSRDRVARVGRDYAYQVSPAELDMMHDIGRFRTVAVEDLLKKRYSGKTTPLNEDLRSLADQGLLQRRSVWTKANRRSLEVVVLTKRGQELLMRERRDVADQRLYSGFVKPAEVAHDAAIYRMYQAEARRIASEGGRVERVVLDYELKQKIYAPLAKSRALPPLDYARKRAEIACANDLPVLAGKIPLPDLRIEFRTKDGESAHVDLELATHHYHGSHLQLKAAAGFKMYAPAESVGSLRSVLDDHDITAEILSL